jgi:organic hydroperoxide reductase OsmC/OhrA
MGRQHSYSIEVRWTGNLGWGTKDYRSYNRNHEISSAGKMSVIPATSDPAFRGDRSRYNPEEMMVAALSGCHMLWVLHLCATAGIIVTEYFDAAGGVMEMNEDGSGQFREVVLRPKLTITDMARASELEAIHHRAHELCFIARSVNFDVRVEAAPVSEKA